MKIKGPTFTIAQFFISFILPLIILVKFSGEDQLGATGGFLLALTFPLAFELYGLIRYKKISAISLVAIGGIIATGIFGIFEISENWLAVRRSALYAATALVLFVSIWIKRPVLNAVMPHVFDMKHIEAAAKKKNNSEKLLKMLRTVSYLLGFIFLAVTILTVYLTKEIITSPSGTTAFNDEYAHLRVLSLPFVTLPLMIGIIAVVSYAVIRLEKLTGLDGDKLLKRH